MTIGTYTYRIKTIIAVMAMVAFSLLFSEARAYTTRIHCAEDTIKVSAILETLNANGGTLGERILIAAHALEGAPLAQAADNDSIGSLIIDMHGFDRLGFVNSVMALAEASRQKLPRVKEYERFLESYSRRKGEDEGFPSKLIYGAEWIVDNIYRGHLQEMTEYLDGSVFKTKTLDYVTRHRDEYPALKDDAAFEKVKMQEMGYRSHRIPHMKKQAVGNKEFIELLNNGDIIMLLCNDLDYDIYDIGFVEMKNGEPYLIHISQTSGKVETDPFPLARLFKINGQHFYGFRWLRPKE